MIVAFKITQERCYDIKLYDSFIQVYNEKKYEIDDFRMGYFYLNGQFIRYQCYISSISTMIRLVIWELNTNKHLNMLHGGVNVAKNKIDIFKKSEWYINYMREMKLNKIIEK